MIYFLIKYKNIAYIVVDALLTDVLKKLNISNYSILNKYNGYDFEGDILVHPFLLKTVKIILSKHVKNDTGTGCVHIAPAYGCDDYYLGIKYGLNIINSIDENGCVYDNVVDFSGLYLDNLNCKVIDLLGDYLVFNEVIKHRYPHCWRHNISLFFRTTSQWFIRVSDNNLQLLANSSVDSKIAWYPEWGNKKMHNMLSSRPDWCVSRQRLWGTPIMLFVNKINKKLHPDMIEILDKLIELVNIKGTDIWFEDNIFNLFCIDSNIYEKVNDVLDVWYDSSVTHRYLNDIYDDLPLPFDVCIEGDDQYRGWFQGSLLISLIMDKHVPYKQVLTHGFVLDNSGRKMSKSLGNIISPLEIINKYGSDILRLWTSSVNYNFDVNLSNEVLSRICEAYRKIRNTMRFLLSNIYDFSYNDNVVNINRMLDIDVWMLFNLSILKNSVLCFYENYDFHLVYKEIYKFCINDLGSRYLDIIKDRLYTTKACSIARRSAQTVLYYLVNVLVQLLSPILSFTSEEIWKYLSFKKVSTVFLTSFSDFNFDFTNKNKIDLSLWQNLFFIKIELNKLLEKYRVSDIIGTSLESDVYIFCNSYWFDILSCYRRELLYFFLVSNVDIVFIDKNNNIFEFVDKQGFMFKLKKSINGKCDRCWIRCLDNHSVNICKRCIDNLYGYGENRLYF